MFKWKIEIDKPQGRYRPSISIYGWLEGKLPDGAPEYENPLNINNKFLSPTLRLAKWTRNCKDARYYRHYPKLPFTVWKSSDPDDSSNETIKEYQVIDGEKVDFFYSTPNLLVNYYLDWIPNATSEMYENIIQVFIEKWMLPLEEEYNKRLTEAINSQAFNITKTNDNHNDNNSNTQSKIIRKIKT